MTALRVLAVVFQVVGGMCLTLCVVIVGVMLVIRRRDNQRLKAARTANPKEWNL